MTGNPKFVQEMFRFVRNPDAHVAERRRGESHFAS